MPLAGIPVPLETTQRAAHGALSPGDGLAARCLRELLGGTPSAHITWHPWKCFAVAAYIRLGGTTVGLQGWARWRSPKHALQYTRHPPTWTRADTLYLPLRLRCMGSLARDLDCASSTSRICGHVRHGLPPPPRHGAGRAHHCTSPTTPTSMMTTHRARECRLWTTTRGTTKMKITDLKQTARR